MLSHFAAVLERDRQTDERTDRQNCYIKTVHQHCCAHAW